MSLIPLFPDDAPMADHTLLVSTRPEGLLAALDENLLRHHLSSFRTLPELDAARDALQQAATRGIAMLPNGQLQQGQLVGWPVLVQPSHAFSWAQICSIPNSANNAVYFDQFMAAWRGVQWVKPQIGSQSVVFPWLIDAETVYDGAPLLPHRAMQHALRRFAKEPQRQPFQLFGRLPEAIRTTRRPLVLLAMAVLFGPANAPAPQWSVTPEVCSRFGALVSNLLGGGQPLQQVLVNQPLPWRAAVRAARAMQIGAALAHGVSHGFITDLEGFPKGGSLAPWEPVHLSLRFRRTADELDDVVEHETWNYPAWWQPSSHLDGLLQEEQTGWLSTGNTTPLALTGNGHTH